MKDHTEAINHVFDALLDEKYGVIKSLDEVSAIGHRVLHGGDKLTESCIIDDKVKDKIREFIKFGPLHNPANLMGIEACEKLAPGKKNTNIIRMRNANRSVSKIQWSRFNDDNVHR